MTRAEAIESLASKLADAPNAADYRAWLEARANVELAALVGEPVANDVVQVRPSIG